MATTVFFIALAFLAGLICGFGADRIIAPAEKISDYEYRILVQNIWRDQSIAADMKNMLVAQLNDYANKAEVELASLHTLLQSMITEIKKIF